MTSADIPRPPGTAPGQPSRGRPRSEQADQAIISAALDLLASHGLSGLSIEQVAARAGVGKATIYRRWPSKRLLALDAFVSQTRALQPMPDTGTLRGDLIGALTSWVTAMTTTPMGPILSGLIAAAQHDQELREAWRARVMEPMRAQRGVLLTRAEQRGEIPPGTDRDLVMDLFFGAAQHRLLLRHLPLDEDFVTSVVDLILSGLLPRPGAGRG